MALICSAVTYDIAVLNALEEPTPSSFTYTLQMKTAYSSEMLVTA
jgi:hypothetical protein